MRSIRIYQLGNHQIHTTINLNDNNTKHISTVLRMQIDDELIIFANDYEYQAKIITVSKKLTTIEILNKKYINRESPCNINLIQAIPKGKRMELIIQKAVELGVTSITPLLTQYTLCKKEQLHKKYQQWLAIAIAACEQCGRNQIPIIYEPITLNNVLKQSYNGNSYVLEPHIGKSWREHPQSQTTINLIIGPEGGFHADELTAIMTMNFVPLKLGIRILRTETAAIAALSLMQAIYGDL